VSFGSVRAGQNPIFRRFRAFLGCLFAFLFFSLGANSQGLASPADYTSSPKEESTPPASSPGTPELPRVVVDTTMPDTVHYLVVTACVKNCDYPNLPAALSNTSCADGLVVKLKAGETYMVSDYTLPVKKCNGNWIIIESDQIASLPPPGTRVTPADAERMPKLTSGNDASPVFETRVPSHHYRFIGLEFTTNINGYGTYLILKKGDNYVVDRCYLHGKPSIAVTRGVILDANYSAVIDSDLSDFHVPSGQAESQAILVPGDETGPLKIDNNYLEAATENVLVGGGGDGNAHDVAITHNHFFKLLSWRPEDPHYVGMHWGVKNLLEFKAAQRVLVEGNLLEYSWGGPAILFTPRLQNGPTDRVEDITFRNNLVRHAIEGFLIVGWDGDCGPSSACVSGGKKITWEYNTQGVQVHRILIENNLWEDLGIHWTSETPVWAFSMMYGASDVRVVHNTFLNDNGFARVGASPKMTGCQIRDNIFGHTHYGLVSIYVASGGSGTDALEQSCTDYIFLKNALVGAKIGDPPYPKTTINLTDWAAVKFVNLPGGDYHLREDSRLHKAATDGKDVGADIDAIYKATRGVSASH
jgi:hypothetical protein